MNTAETARTYRGHFNVVNGGTITNLPGDCLEAAVNGDVSLLKQAMMMDPLVGAVCNPQEISQMTDEMLVAQAQWLPQYADEIPAAKKRLESEKPLGTRGTAGAARLTFKKSMDRLLK